ncbi:MAG: winged helix-turn-helix transcriptional regulator [Desulfobacterales bacterium]|nr:winged helix-turn-helix transcriptional regulator [Desulfobacterales bacterium]
MKKFTKVMKALSDPSRVRILKMLQRKQMCVCEIQNALGIAQSTASKHLKILEEAGLTTYKKDGLWVNYTLADGSDSPYAAAMLGNIRHWLENEKEITELSTQIFDIRREDICRAKDRQNQRNNH